MAALSAVAAQTPASDGTGIGLHRLEGDVKNGCIAPKGPEAWLELMGGNVRIDGLRLDLQSIKDAGISGVHFFHIDRGGAWPECPEQIPCMSGKWYDVVKFLGEECERLGLELTVQNCPGWSQSGGPWVDLDHCQRDIKMVRRDFDGGNGAAHAADGEGTVVTKALLPEVPEKFRDRDSDWRDICVLAFPTPDGDSDSSDLCPERVEKDGENRIFHFAAPVTVRSLVLPGVDKWNNLYAYEMPWMRVALDVKDGDGWREVVRSPLPVTNWRDYVETFTLACGEATGDTWRFRFEHDLPIKNYCEPRLSSAPRMTDWEGKSARTLRSLLQDPPPAQAAGCFVDQSRIVDITGNAGWRVPEGRWTVIRLGHVNAKRVNAPAPKEATGWECDKLDPKGIEACFRGYIGRLNDGVLKGRMKGMLVDSWECFGQTWTPKMERYFADANGYALRKWLPALFGWVVGSPSQTERFLTDWRRTNGDLITKNYFGRMSELAHEAGLKAYYETAFGDIIYGDLLEYWKYADAPMCEFWYPHRDRLAGGCGWYSFKPIRPCASAAHIYGKRRVVAEAFTGSGIHWDEDFRKLQDDANRHFARGVTHLAFQSYTHAPAPDALPPGGCMGGYNGTPFTRLQTWWKHMPEFTAWLTRCEEFLEAGQPAQDVLWYLGDAVDHKPDETYPFPEGFRADYLNHDVLTNRLVVKDGVFAIPEGAEWKVLWVPDVRFMLPATRAALKRLSDAGGRVVFGGKDELAKALAHYEKDVATEPALGDEPSEDFMWIHRKVDGFDRYFVAAGTNGWRGKVTFRAAGAATVFDPVSCERTAWHNGDVLDIPPSRSVFVEFGKQTGFEELDGPRNPFNPLRLPKNRMELTGWTLSFPSGWGAPEKLSLERPVSWTDIPGFSREAQAFGGTVTYETAFECPAEDSCFELDLGKVESIAKVFVNGKPVRTLWCEPYRCRLDGFVRKGKNSLRIEVTNTWRNRVIYDLGLPGKDRKTWMLYQPHYNPKSTDPFVPSGILGPVAVIAYRGGLVLAERGKEAEYSIAVPKKASQSQMYAAEELRDFTEKATGVRLPIVTDAVPLPEKAIVLQAGVDAAVGSDGFRLKAEGGRLYIIGSAERGALYGVYEVLERFVGCRWYASWHSAVPKRDRVEVPADLDETHTPAFAMREPFWYDVIQHPEFAARLRVNSCSWGRLGEKFGGDPYRFGGGLGSCHTFNTLLPPDRYFDEHPEYFSMVKGKRIKSRTQLCLTNPDVLRIVTSNVLERIRKDPGARFYGVSQNDWYNFCECPDCKAVDDEEGSHSGTMVRFVNAVAEAVEKEFPDATIETLAYQYTRKAPKKTRLRHNVVPCLCTIECDFALPLDKSPFGENKSFCKDIEDWSGLTDFLYIWDYTTDFAHYTLPWPNVLALQGNVQFFRRNNVKALFEQGDYQGGHADFAALKAWLLAKWMWNPDLPMEPLLGDFFAGYYGKGAPFVREYFDRLHKLQTEYSAQPNHPLRIFDGVENPAIPNSFFEDAAVLWDKAIAAVKDDPGTSFNVRMGAFSVDYARLERSRRLLSQKTSAPAISMERLKAMARSLLARMDEAKDMRLAERDRSSLVQEWRKIACGAAEPVGASGAERPRDETSVR